MVKSLWLSKIMRVVKEYVGPQMTVLLHSLSVLGNVRFTGNSFLRVCVMFLQIVWQLQELGSR